MAQKTAVLLTPAVSAFTSQDHGEKVLMLLDRTANRRSETSCSGSIYSTSERLQAETTV